MDWLDRLSGERHAAPVEPFTPGQWEYRGQRHILIRDTEARAGDLLLPAPDGRLHAPSIGPLRCDPHYTPDDDALRCLRLVGDRLRTLENHPWRDWVAETPLLPELADALDESPLEREVASKIGYLESACERPRTHLRLEEERLVVSRCKRPSIKAPTELAARSEDWERRTIWGVRPRRILGMVSEELFDIYENRVAVALVDHLDAALFRRLRAVRRIVQLLRQREDYQYVLGNSLNYRRAYRVLELWGEALENKGQLAHAEQVHHRLVALRRRVLVLKNTLLYQQIGGRHSARLQLQMTNVLVHDDVYRRITELWIAWEEHVRSQSLDPGIRWRQEQEAASGYSEFVFLVVIRALDSLGYRPEGDSSETAINGRGEWRLQGPGGTILLRRNASEISLLSTHTERPLRFVPLPAMLEAGVTVGEWIETVKDLSLAIVALPPDESRAPHDTRCRLRSLGNQGENAGPMFVAAAPWDLESVERVARAIRWYVWSALYGTYPLSVELPDDHVLPPARPSWIRVKAGAFFVVRPPGEHEWPWEDFVKVVESANSAVLAKQKELDACDPRRHNRQRLRLRQELDTAVSFRGNVQGLAAELDRAIAHVELLLGCPVCRKTADPIAFRQVDELFSCRCADCGTTWGQRGCAGCGRPFAFLDFAGNRPSEDLLDVDRRYGADVLALPIDDQVYLCPWCGQHSHAHAGTVTLTRAR